MYRCNAYRAAHCFTELPDNRGNSECGDIVEALVTFTFNLSGTPAGNALLAGYNAYKTTFNLLQVALGREPTSPVGTLLRALACAHNEAKGGRLRASWTDAARLHTVAAPALGCATAVMVYKEAAD
jgi:hypothetical protein